MLKFVEREQEYPEIREAKLRREDFEEIYAPFAVKKAADQAARCSQCGIPFCQTHCPLQNNIPDWLRLTAEGRLKEAYQVASLTNSFPDICGRICPQDRLCEGNCVIEKGFGSVTIGAVEKYITDTAWEEGWVEGFAPASETGRSVGIIGSGPAGLAAAEALRRQGHAVHVYERSDRVGGLLMYGIPNFKLDKKVVTRRQALFEESGVVFHTNAGVGDKKGFATLRKKHEALLIATGVYRARATQVLGSHLKNIVPAMAYLTASNRKGLGDKVKEFESGALNAEGKCVVVIGGGDTAMDCVRTAVRQGAKSVVCLYRRDRENMPGSRREVLYAEQEGVEFQWLSAPKAFMGEETVEKILVQHMRLGPADASGRRAPEPVPEGDTVLKADLVIEALGFDAEELPEMFGQPELQVQPAGTLKVNDDGMTTMDGVFAAGDIVRGASLVVWAIRDGREVAAGMDAWLRRAA